MMEKPSQAMALQERDLEPGPGEARVSRLVVIGRAGFDRAAVTAALEAATLAAAA